MGQVRFPAMNLTEEDCNLRLTTARFGVLGTSDADRSVHLVPVVFVVQRDRLVIPIDTVKPKKSPRLRRVANLERDPRCALLVDHRAEDWSQLWWVRAELSYRDTVDVGAWATPLVGKYPQYDDPGAVAAVLEFSIDRCSGWSGA